MEWSEVEWGQSDPVPNINVTRPWPLIKSISIYKENGITNFRVIDTHLNCIRGK